MATAPRSGSAADSPLRHLPNLITVLRILLVPPLALALLDRAYVLALALTLIAGFSDALDGFLARQFRWHSRLGALLDPLADKLLLATCFIGLSLNGVVPLTLTALVLLRDAVIVGGAIAWQRVVGAVQVRPSLLSKANTLLQIVYVLAALAGHALARPLPLAVPAVAVGALTLASGVDYVVRWSLRARNALRIRHGESQHGR